MANEANKRTFSRKQVQVTTYKSRREHIHAHRFNVGGKKKTSDINNKWSALSTSKRSQLLSKCGHY
jgi:hypothetical protein